MNEIVKELGWSLSDVRKSIDWLHFQYCTLEGPQIRHSSNLELKEQHKKSLKFIFKWILDNTEPPRPYVILGQTVTPYYEISYIRRVIIRETFGTPEGSIIIGLVIKHPTEDEAGPEKIYVDNQLPGEIRELLFSIDEYLWSHIRESIIMRFRLPENALPTHMKKHVFLAYRDKNEQSEQTAKILGRFLQEKGMRIWLFPWRIGWADSITEKEEQAILDSFGAVICFTPDFLEGRTAKDEYRALIAKRRREPDFKLGYLLIGCNHEVVPPFMADYFGAKIENFEDEKFEKEANKVYRGLLGLPLESFE